MRRHRRCTRIFAHVHTRPRYMRARARDRTDRLCVHVCASIRAAYAVCERTRIREKPRKARCYKGSAPSSIANIDLNHKDRPRYPIVGLRLIVCSLSLFLSLFSFTFSFLRVSCDPLYLLSTVTTYQSTYSARFMCHLWHFGLMPLLREQIIRAREAFSPIFMDAHHPWSNI